MAVWLPDFCPASPGCEIETNADQSAVVRFHRRCSYHVARPEDDAALFTEIRGLTSAKERARAAVAAELGLDGNVDVPYRVEPDGRIVIEAGKVGLPVARRAALIATARADIAKDEFAKRAPVSKIEVE